MPAAASSPRPVALANGLIYVNPEMPGLSRVRRGTSFRYRDVKGQWLRDVDEISRIRQLAIPPAYTEVWICPLPNGHLQATGLDARGRKQYRYHAEWRVMKHETKFERLEAFGRALPRIHARVARDLQPGPKASLDRELVLATLVRLLDTTFLQVGNEEYASSNGSYGLTTLRNKHANVRGTSLRLSFRGKSGVLHEAKLADPLARVVRRCQQLPGQELFQYQEDGTVQALELTRLACDDVESQDAVSRHALQRQGDPGRRRQAVGQHAGSLQEGLCPPGRVSARRKAGSRRRRDERHLAGGHRQDKKCAPASLGRAEVAYFSASASTRDQRKQTMAARR